MIINKLKKRTIILNLLSKIDLNNNYLLFTIFFFNYTNYIKIFGNILIIFLLQIYIS